MNVKRKNLIKRLSVLIVVFTVFMVSTSAVSSIASIDNDTIGYSFEIVPYGKVSKYPVSRYRSTTDVNNAWKVELVNSNESSKGTRTATSFHLGVYNPNGYNPKGSGTYAARLGSDFYYHAAYSNASKADVYLYGRDNLDTNSFSYSVSGHWDEETGQPPGAENMK